MRKSIAVLITLLSMYSTVSFATDITPATPAVPLMSSVIQKLQTLGYSIIRKIKFEDGAFEAQVINAQGKEIKVRVNPLTGELYGSPENSARLGMFEVVKKVEDSGYHNIYNVVAENNYYEVKALDKNGKHVDLEVDAKTGEISKDWF